tara:strand:- start:5874 stop:6572 length:699 start_codon:yes stop_codon:yes gene_type:complete
MSGTEALHVVGNEYFGSTIARSGLDGMTVAARLIREPNNRSDKNAVGVHVGGAQIGYVSAARAQKITKWMDSVGGQYDTTVTYRDGGADVLVPADWVFVPREERINIQRTTDHQPALTELGPGTHRCKVIDEGERLRVEVAGAPIGYLYPKTMSEATVAKVRHNRQQKLEVKESAHRDGLYARIIAPAPKAPRPPAPALGPPPTPPTAAPTASPTTAKRSGFTQMLRKLVGR